MDPGKCGYPFRKLFLNRLELLNPGSGTLDSEKVDLYVSDLILPVN